MKQEQLPLLLRCAGLALSVFAITACDEFSESRSLGTLERDRIRIVADSAEPITRILVREGDRFDLTGLADLAPGGRVSCTVHHADGKTDSIALAHTMTVDQIAWFRAGSALNKIKADNLS